MGWKLTGKEDGCGKREDFGTGEGEEKGKDLVFGWVGFQLRSVARLALPLIPGS